MAITAPLTGTVYQILVAEGDKVAGGDTVIILESMKMEIEVNSDFDGTVKEIRCAEGDVVQPDDVLIVLE
jgi:acetyl-CoA carboxylase biotin carboxyl carrier protein